MLLASSSSRLIAEDVDRALIEVDEFSGLDVVN